ncbi:MAG: methyltransferase [Pseudomonadota bacterium]
MAVRDPDMRQGWSPSGWFARLIARPGFQNMASALPFGRGMARRDGADIFDILQGFVVSQVLAALIELNILRTLLDGPQSAEKLGFDHAVPAERMDQLLRGGMALGLLKRRRDGRYALARKGAAILGVPGLENMIRHNREFYADMADPVALLRGVGETHLARFWPYVFGAGGDIDPDVADRYSTLMAESQVLVAKDTLSMLPIKGDVTVMDVGGGSGVFLAEVLRRNKQARGILFDLPEVMPQAETRVANLELGRCITLRGGSFRTDTLPEGADVISLIRVLYDHEDATVMALLKAVHEALPKGGRLIISEPMAGGVNPERSGDLYFAFYTMAMGTGRARSAQSIAEMCRQAGFEDVHIPKARRPYITSALRCRKPGV